MQRARRKIIIATFVVSRLAKYSSSSSFSDRFKISFRSLKCNPYTSMPYLL